MFNHNDLFELQSQSLKMQSMVRQKTFLPDDQKILRRFSSWEVAAIPTSQRWILYGSNGLILKGIGYSVPV